MISSASKLLYAGNYFSTFVEGLLVDVVASPLWHQYGAPPVGDGGSLSRLVKLCLPNLGQHPRRQREVQSALSVLNAPLLPGSARLPHNCVILPETGFPCCHTLQMVQSKIKLVVSQLLVTHKPDIPSMKD